MHQKKMTGLTLVELMIVVVIIGILAAIAYPTFIDQIRKSRRAEAHDAMTNIALAEEKYRANNPSYTNNLADLNFAVSANQPWVTDWYSVAVSNAGRTTYTITADPQGDQAKDTRCDPMTLDQDGTKSPEKCW